MIPLMEQLEAQKRCKKALYEFRITLLGEWYQDEETKIENRFLFIIIPPINIMISFGIVGAVEILIAIACGIKRPLPPNAACWVIPMTIIISIAIAFLNLFIVGRLGVRAKTRLRQECIKNGATPPSENWHDYLKK